MGLTVVGGNSDEIADSHDADCLELDPGSSEMALANDIKSLTTVLTSFIAQSKENNARLDSRMDSLVTAINALNVTTEKVLNENKELKNEITKLSSRVNQLETKQGPAGFHLLQAICDAEGEKQERAEKKTNFVVYGLPEPEEDETDKEVVKSIFERSGANSDVVMNVSRMGDKRDGSKFPQLLKVKTDSFEEKMIVMRAQKIILLTIKEFQFERDMGFSRYLRDDMTLAQRKHHSELKLQRDKLNQEEDTRKSGIKWKIINYQLQSWRSMVPTGQ